MRASFAAQWWWWLGVVVWEAGEREEGKKGKTCPVATRGR